MIAALGAPGTGCGATATKPLDQNRVLASELDDMRAQRRRDRIRIRQMEERMAELAAARAGDRDRPRLPVERVGPAEPAPAGDAELDRGVAIAGVEDDGTEILYVGEAAREGSVAAPTALFERTPTRVATTRGSRTAVPLELDERASGDSLGVTGGRLPTVGAVTRGSLAPRAREPVPALSRRRSRPPPEGAAAVADYQKSVAELRAGRHTAAIAGFRRFIARYPRSDYADNARYWLGEAYYDQKRFAEARVEFERVVADYPRGNKVPDAMLKAAYCEVAIGDLASARGSLQHLIAKFPSSRVARLAGEKLGQLNK